MKYLNWKSIDDEKINGAFELVPDFINDDRGFFSRLLDTDEISEKLGYEFKICQINNSLSSKVNTMRGFHMQLGKSAETKIIRCISGACFDYILDLRPESATFLKFGVIELDSVKRNCACLPKGCAHAIRTIKADTEVIYYVDNYYDPNSEFGLNPLDPIFKSFFASNQLHISKKDESWPDLDLKNINFSL